MKQDMCCNCDWRGERIAGKVRALINNELKVCCFDNVCPKCGAPTNPIDDSDGREQ